MLSRPPAFSLNQDHDPIDRDNLKQQHRSDGPADGVFGPLAVLLAEAWTLGSSHTLSPEGEEWAGRAGQVPEVCNLLRHLKIIKNFMLGRYRIPVAVAVAQRGARGETEKAVGSSREATGMLLASGRDGVRLAAW